MVTLPCVVAWVPAVKVFGSPATVLTSPVRLPLIAPFSSPELVPGLAVTTSGAIVSVMVAVDVAPEWSVTT